MCFYVDVMKPLAAGAACSIVPMDNMHRHYQHEPSHHEASDHTKKYSPDIRHTLRHFNQAYGLADVYQVATAASVQTSTEPGPRIQLVAA